MPTASYDACISATLIHLGAPDGALLPILHAFRLNTVTCRQMPCLKLRIV